ncbi:FabD/lysophospholipase-like protein [Mollisia scopiformis]|uniref:FabD/lysophospholipase-like protein n=1 Tax=Mollisia scopiformis TaxID=149040 RepID=A0A132BFQ4_MOLSC|nr:FabD/lysophospholipase-like protein [Mollisia scopiformis]KUJ10547.1 FabD/lysophospholipase-like protein [Mollisia scopiformis]
MEIDTATVGDPLRLLSLDGGGIHGLSALFILQDLMRSVNPDNPPKPCDYFDPIGWTSTGGLIAIMLGRLGMDIQQCIDAYQQLSKGAFHPRRQLRIPFRRAQGFDQVSRRFDGDKITQIVKEIVRGAGEHADARLKLSEDPQCKVFVCAAVQDVIEPILLRNYDSPGVSQDNCMIWEACRATSAATPFFEPAVPPSNGQLSEGVTSWNNSYWDWSPTMDPPQSNVIQTLKAIVAEAGRTAEDFESEHKELGLFGSYFRFNVEEGLENVGLDEYTAVPTIVSAKTAYLRNRGMSELQHCVSRLRQQSARQDVTSRLCALDTNEQLWLLTLFNPNLYLDLSTQKVQTVDGCTPFKSSVDFRRFKLRKNVYIIDPHS